MPCSILSMHVITDVKLNLTTCYAEIVMWLKNLSLTLLVVRLLLVLELHFSCHGSVMYSIVISN